MGTAMVGHDGHRGRAYYVAVDAGRRGQALGYAVQDTVVLGKLFDPHRQAQQGS